MQRKDKEGNEKPFAFICYDRKDDKAYGPQCADNAVRELHEQVVDGHKLYVQPALPSDQRHAQVQREQIRFKNSKKKCNLFVKNFPNTYTREDLENLFKPYGEIESVKIIPSEKDASNQREGQAKRAFVCFKSPDFAASARQNLHGQTLENRQLFVTNYELPEIRKKQQAEAKDRVDFVNHRKGQSAPFDQSILTRPDIIQLIQQILSIVQRQKINNNPYGQFNQGGNRGAPLGQQQQQQRGGVFPNNKPRYNNQGGPRQHQGGMPPQAPYQGGAPLGLHPQHLQ